MLQIVHDVAPGASLAFYTADNSEADFANGIVALATAGAKVEADDTVYFDEPFFQDGILAQAVDQVEAQGVAYFSAAGNDAEFSYENTAPSFATLSATAPNTGEYLLNLDTTGATTTTALPVSIPALFPGEFLAVVVEWDQPYVTGAPGSPGASSQIDLCVTGASGSDRITDLDGNSVACTGPNAIGVDPVQVLIIGNPANASGNSATESLNLLIGLANGSTAPGRIKLALEADGALVSINAFATNSATLQGHPGAAGAVAVGAAFFPQTPRCGTSPAILEPYSSEGGAPILFDASGTRLATPEIRQKPDVVGPDGVNTTFFGVALANSGFSDNSSVSQCQNDANYPSFFGTSAATPHVASIAALMLQANSAVTPTQIYDALRDSAAAMDTPSPDFETGYGFVQADAALAQLPPAAAAPRGGGGGGGLGGSPLLVLAVLACARLVRKQPSTPQSSRLPPASPARRNRRRSMHQARHGAGGLA
jgi:subtilisin family serine protease